MGVAGVGAGPDVELGFLEEEEHLEVAVFGVGRARDFFHPGLVPAAGVASEPIKSLLRHSDLLDSAAHEQHVDDMVGTRLEPYTSDQVRANVRGIDGGVVRLGSGEEEGEFAAAVVGFDDDGGAEVGKDEAPRPGGDECQCQAKFGGRLGRNSKNFVHELCRELCHGGCSALDELVIG